MAYINSYDKVIGITCSTVTALNTEIALAVSDASIKKSSGAEVVNASGKRKAYGSKPGKAEATGSFEFILTPATAAVLDLGIDETVHEFTYNEGTGLEKATGCRATSVKVSGEFAGNVIVSVDFIAEAVTAGAAITAEAGLTTPYVCLNVTSALSSGKNIESFEVGVSNNFDSVYGMVGASRLPAEISPGYQGGGTLGVNYLESPTFDPLAADLASEGTAESTIDLTIGQADGGAPSVTFEFVALRPGDLDKKISPESIVKWDANYIFEDMTYSLAAE